MSVTERFIETEIEIMVPPLRVWRAWTEGDEFVAWWGEDGKYRVTNWTGDLQPGGNWRAEGTLANGESFWVGGRYVEVAPPNEDGPGDLSFTWRHDWDDPSEETLVRLQFLPTPAGTLLKLHHTGFRTDKSCDNHRAGWAQVLGWLGAHLDTEHS